MMAPVQQPTLAGAQFAAAPPPQAVGYPVAQAMLELKQARSRAFMAAYRRKRD